MVLLDWGCPWAEHGGRVPGRGEEEAQERGGASFGTEPCPSRCTVTLASPCACSVSLPS